MDNEELGPLDELEALPAASPDVDFEELICKRIDHYLVLATHPRVSADKALAYIGAMRFGRDLLEDIANGRDELKFSEFQRRKLDADAEPIRKARERSMLKHHRTPYSSDNI